MKDVFSETEGLMGSNCWFWCGKLCSISCVYTPSATAYNSALARQVA